MRLERARQRQVRASDGSPGTMRDPGLGLAARSGVEFVAAIVVSAGIGVLVDRWLHWRVAGLLVMLALGFGAGLLNIYRALNGMPYGATYKGRKVQDRTADDERNDG